MGSFLRIPEQTAGSGGLSATASGQAGLRIKLSRIPGVTKEGLRYPYYFQCPPLETFQHDHSYDHARYTTIEGEFSRRGGRRLAVANFRTVAVEWGAFVTEFSFDVQKLVKSLENVCERGYPFEMLCWHKYNPEPELHMSAVLENVSISELAGEPDARYIDLAITEWRDPVVARAKVGGSKRAKKSALPFTVELRKDGTFVWHSTWPGQKTMLGHDLTFARIAKAAYGKPSLARLVAQANNITNWGYNEPLKNHPRFKGKKGKVLVPEPVVSGPITRTTAVL